MLIRRACKNIFNSVMLDQHRCIYASSVLYGKRNFRKFQMPNKRGTACDKAWLSANYDEVDHRGQRPVKIKIGRKKIIVPEMIPEIIVPDLTDFQLKPYVSYRARDVIQEEFTAQDLFFSVYSEKIKKDFEEGKLDEEGNPLEPSEDEKLDAETAKQRVRSIGSDLFG